MGDESVERRRIESMNGVERERKWERGGGRGWDDQYYTKEK